MLPLAGFLANGALAPERVIVTPQGRPIILEFVVGVALDTMKQLQTQLVMRQYRGFIR